MTTSIQSLPSELLIQIFAYLDPDSLEQIGLVCDEWHRLTQDNAVWAKVFAARFPGAGKVFTSASRTASWKDELLTRDPVSKAWQRGRGFRRSFARNQNPGPPSFGELHVDFDRDRLVCYDPNSGRLISCKASSGRGLDYGVCETPTGTTSYSAGAHAVVFGRWNGQVHGTLVDYKNLTVHGVKQYQGFTHNAMVTSVYVASGVLPPTAITGDQEGVLQAWDAKLGKSVRDPIKIGPNAIVQIDSDGKDRVVVLDGSGVVTLVTGGLLRGKESTVEELGQLEPPGADSRLLVDYGGQVVLVYSGLQLEALSFDGVTKRLVMGNTTTEGSSNKVISMAALEESSHRFLDRDRSIVGNDPLMMAAVLQSGEVMIVDVRDSKYSLKPKVTFLPRAVQKESAMVTSVLINGYCVLVGTADGSVDMYDVFTGQFLRRVSERLGKRMLAGMRSLPATRIIADEKQAVGIIGFGPVIQFFHFGDLFQEESKKAKKKWKKTQDRDGKASTDELRASLEDYEYQADREAEAALEAEALVDRYNGVSDDPEDELQMALAMSMSMENVAAVPEPPSEAQMDADAEDEDLRQAIAMSLEGSAVSLESSSQSILTEPEPIGGGRAYSGGRSYSGSRSYSGDEDDEEEQLRRALELSMLDQ